MLARLDQWAARLTSLAALIGTLGLLAQVLVILSDVIGRYFGAPLRGAQDISTMAMVIVVFGGMALCERLDGHLSVDLFEPHMPRWLRHAADVLAALLGAAIFFGIAWTVLESAALSRLLNLSTNIIRLPKAWFQYALAGFALITAFGLSMRAAFLLLKGHNGRTVEDAE
ncbi:TRAP transporter small permease [Breoghania sp.]|uniref:TRAP transporter small permease n=1 Tax=Breoghania sp. TaxID=2065378 RepID=UPI002AAB9C99|nr:TRAP transporter small permease [Breoghania sp.]